MTFAINPFMCFTKHQHQQQYTFHIYSRGINKTNNFPMAITQKGEEKTIWQAIIIDKCLTVVYILMLHVSCAFTFLSRKKSIFHFHHIMAGNEDGGSNKKTKREIKLILKKSKARNEQETFTWLIGSRENKVKCSQ